MSKNLYLTWKGLLFVILFYLLLPLQSASATLLEYSISGNVSVWNTDDIWTPLEITGTAFIEDEKYGIGNPDCITGYNNSCSPLFNITYFDMSVGDQYSFTGSGYTLYSPSDVYGTLYGTGDWTEIYHSGDCSGPVGPCADFQSYEEWLAFELPSEIWFEAGYLCCNGSIEVSNPDLFDVRHIFSVTMERVGPASVPEPSILALMASGLIGFGFTHRRKYQS